MRDRNEILLCDLELIALKEKIHFWRDLDYAVQLKLRELYKQRKEVSLRRQKASKRLLKREPWWDTEEYLRKRRAEIIAQRS